MKSLLFLYQWICALNTYFWNPPSTLLGLLENLVQLEIQAVVVTVVNPYIWSNLKQITNPNIRLFSLRFEIVCCFQSDYSLFVVHLLRILVTLWERTGERLCGWHAYGRWLLQFLRQGWRGGYNQTRPTKDDVVSVIHRWRDCFYSASYRS